MVAKPRVSSNKNEFVTGFTTINEYRPVNTTVTQNIIVETLKKYDMGIQLRDMLNNVGLNYTITKEDIYCGSIRKFFGLQKERIHINMNGDSKKVEQIIKVISLRSETSHKI